MTRILTTLLALAATACSLDLGEAPFLCHNGLPRCPDGYECVPSSGTPNGICIKEGAEPPVSDARPPDRGPPIDGKPPADGPPVDDGPLPPDLPPQVGQVLVSEFMADPDMVTDTNGEWLELFNAGGQGVDINGWTLKDQGSDSHVIKNGGPLVVPAKGYLLLGRTTDKAANGGVNVVYAYQQFYIANTEDEIILLDGSGKQVDSFIYSKAAGFTIPKGASLSLKNPNSDKNKPGSWCTETKPWPGSKGDKGTPGFNPGC